MTDTTTTIMNSDLTVTVKVKDGVFLTTENGHPIITESNSYIIGENTVQVSINLNTAGNNG